MKRADTFSPLVAAKLRAAGRFQVMNAFFDDVAAVSGANPGTGTKNLQVAGDYFGLIDLTASIIVNATQTLRPNVLVQITDTRNGETLFDAFVPIWCVAGDAFQPYSLPAPRWFYPNNAITVQIQNFEASTVDVRFNLHGARVNAQDVKEALDREEREEKLRAAAVAQAMKKK